MKPIEITDQNFDIEVLRSSLPILVDFWAPWCAPCRMIAPIIEQLAIEYQGKAKVGKLNVDDNQNAAIKYGVRSIPTLLFFKNGEVKDMVIGTVSKNIIEQKLKALL
jgi:thioredoxin 1